MTKRPSMRDRILSRQAADEGMGLVADNNADWMDEAGLLIALLPLGWEGTGEDIRYRLIEKEGLWEPTKPQAWGALINACIKAGFLELINLGGRMRAVRSHARRTPIYRRENVNGSSDVERT